MTLVLATRCRSAIAQQKWTRRNTMARQRATLGQQGGRPSSIWSKTRLSFESLEPRLLFSTALLPDLIVRDSADEGYLPGWTSDTAEEPGHTLLRLTTAIANIGTGPMELRGGTRIPTAPNRS